MRVPLLILVLASLPALARPWQGIDPGTSLRADVVKKFGEPSKVTAAGGFDVLTYLKDKAIKGTAQSQFRVAKDTGVVDRIDVFPEPTNVILQDEVEKKYGAECAAGEKEGCYLRRPQEKKPPYFLYTQLGLAIFFRPDGKTVELFTFLSTRKK